MLYILDGIIIMIIILLSSSRERGRERNTFKLRLHLTWNNYKLLPIWKVLTGTMDFLNALGVSFIYVKG